MTRASRRTSRKEYDDYDEQHREHFNRGAPPRKNAAVDTKTVGMAGILMFLMTNFKKEIGQILIAISKFIGGS